MERMIGFRDAYEVCRYCGKQFHYNDCRPEQRSGAFDEKRKHESICPVRFGLEECPEKWKKKLEEVKEKIEASQKIINELREGLKNGSIHPLLREKAEEIIWKEESNIWSCKEFLEEDSDIKEIIAILKTKKEK